MPAVIIGAAYQGSLALLPRLRQPITPASPAMKTVILNGSAPDFLRCGINGFSGRP
jgi:hypothetical protein